MIKEIDNLIFFLRIPRKSRQNPSPSQISPVSKRKKKKELGKSGKRRENLHTGSVFRAEQDWTGYTSDFLVYPGKKTRFFPKKNFEVALTPNLSTNDYKILGKEKYAFFLFACKISAKSVQ